MREIINAPEVHMPSRFVQTDMRILSETKPGALKLWTFQPISLWTAIQSSHNLTVDPSMVPTHNREWYWWMKSQMNIRLSDYTGKYPWWAYASRKPDMRSWNFQFPQGTGVCLELQLSPNVVLLSDYETWHAVLNQYIAYTRAEDEAWERSLLQSQQYAGFFSGNIKRMMEASWERIFDLDGLVAGDMWKVQTVQACFENFSLKDVISVSFLVPRI